MTSVLISGASVAGPTLAYWLRQRGFTPTVIERAASPRPGGQAIDVRGVALEVVRRMGVYDAIATERTRMTGMSVLDDEGKELWRSTEMTFSAGRFDSGDIEILRDDLTRILLDLTKDCEYVFDESITALASGPDGVDVTFEKAAPRRFDLVIGADGLFSNVRRLAFGEPGAFVHHMNACVGIFTIPNTIGLDNWQVAFGTGSARGLVYPARANKELRVFLGFESAPVDRGLTTEQLKTLVTDRCAGLGWEVPKMLQAMSGASDFYFGEMAQVRMPSWANGRVALVGDAGYCPSPMSGQGTSLALIGAYVLAEEMGRSPGEHAAAFARCEARMRPFVDLNQALAIRDRDERPSDEAIDHAKNAISLDNTA